MIGLHFDNKHYTTFPNIQHINKPNHNWATIDHKVYGIFWEQYNNYGVILINNNMEYLLSVVWCIIPKMQSYYEVQ